MADYADQNQIEELEAELRSYMAATLRLRRELDEANNKIREVRKRMERWATEDYRGPRPRISVEAEGILKWL